MMELAGAIVFLPREGNGRSLMLEDLLFDPAALWLAEALRRNGVEFEMHIYPKGEHGLSLAAEETAGERREMLVPSVQSWIHLAKTWIEGFGNA